MLRRSGSVLRCRGVPGRLVECSGSRMQPLSGRRLAPASARQSIRIYHSDLGIKCGRRPIVPSSSKPRESRGSSFRPGGQWNAPRWCGRTCGGRLPAGDHGGTSPRAGWMHLRIRQAHALVVKRVKIRCPDHQISARRDVTVFLSAGDSEQNVGTLLQGGRTPGRPRRSSEGPRRKSFTEPRL